MSDSEIDMLERRAQRTDIHGELGTDPLIVLSLIQRLREAELNRDLAQAALRDFTNGLDHKRIAQLERVREAAAALLEDVDYPGADGLGAAEGEARPALRAALAAAEEPSRK